MDPVADVFLPIATPRPDKPDETYLIDTCTTTLWLLWPPLVGDQSYYDLGADRQPLREEFNPAGLVSATRR